MNPQIEGVIRSIVIAAFSVAGALGWAASGVDPLVVASALVTLASVGWSIWSNRPKNLAAQAAQSPEVLEVKMASQAAADSIPDSKVTGPNQ